MGTDALGRDLWARVASGARVSLLVAVGSTAIALAIGIALGALSGFAGGRVDSTLMRVVDIFYSLPDVLLIVLLTDVLQAGLVGVPDLYRRLLALMIALGGVGWVTVARLVRGLVPAAILSESTVSFIGLGIQPPFSSWGVLAADGFPGLRSYPHLIFFPGLAILVTLLGFHFLGEALRERLDPHRA
jgi:oligopeptide transport system permease protein